MLLLVESFYSIAGSIVVHELRLVFNFIEFRLVSCRSTPFLL